MLKIIYTIVYNSITAIRESNSPSTVNLLLMVILKTELYNQLSVYTTGRIGLPKWRLVMNRWL